MHTFFPVDFESTERLLNKWHDALAAYMYMRTSHNSYRYHSPNSYLRMSFCGCRALLEVSQAPFEMLPLCNQGMLQNKQRFRAMHPSLAECIPAKCNMEDGGYYQCHTRDCDWCPCDTSW